MSATPGVQFNRASTNLCLPESTSASAAVSIPVAVARRPCADRTCERRIRRDQRLMGQKRERKKNVHHGAPSPAAASRIGPSRPASSARTTENANWNHGGTKRIAMVTSASKAGCRQNRPSQDEQQTDSRLDQAAAQVVGIFHRDRTKWIGDATSGFVGHTPRSQLTICQSPRTQRCLRRLYAL